MTFTIGPTMVWIFGNVIILVRFVQRIMPFMLTCRKFCMLVTQFCPHTADCRTCLLYRANLPNRYSAPCWRPVTHAQTWASYSALYRFGRLSLYSIHTDYNDRSYLHCCWHCLCDINSYFK